MARILGHCQTAVLFLLTVILTNVRQRSGPKRLWNVSRYYGSRPDVLVRTCCSQTYTQHFTALHWMQTF